MANAYYYAAHFNSSAAPTYQSQTTTTFSKPTPTLSLIGASVKNTTTIHNGFVWAAQQYSVPWSTTNEQQASPLFRLPAELRNEIYKELFCSEIPSLKELTQFSSSRHKPTAVYPAILATCRRAHEEATPLLYSTHVFHAHSSLLTSLPHLTSPARPVLCPSVLSQIKRWQLTLRLDTDPRFTEAQATAAFSGAEFLEIKAWQSMYDGCDSSVLKLFMGVRGVKVARVSGSAEPELAAWLEARMMRPVEEEEEKKICHCENGGGEVRCMSCNGKIEFGRPWFAGRDVWTFSSR